MFNTEYHARVGFVKVLDRTCTQCKGIWASNEHSTCPKCGLQLVLPTIQTDKGPRPYCFTEVTIYPVMPEKFKTAYADKLQKSKSLPWLVRLKLWGHYDEVNKIVTPNGRTPYLTPKKEILVKTNTPPLYSIFHTKEQVPILQILHEIGKNDSITFIGPKEASTIEQSTNAVVTPNVNPPQEVKPVTTSVSAQPESNAVIEILKMKSELLETKLRLIELQSKSKPAMPPTEVSSPDPENLSEASMNSYAEGDEGYSIEPLQELEMDLFSN